MQALLVSTLAVAIAEVGDKTQLLALLLAARFRQWAQGVAERNAYAVRFSDIGQVHPQHGSSTQMAHFNRVVASPSLR